MKRILAFTIILLIFIPFISSFEMVNKTINLSEISLDEKIGQLMIVKPEGWDEKYMTELKVGGIFLNDLRTKENYLQTIDFYKNKSKIELFVSTDMEGYWNPFSEFYKSKNFGEVNSSQDSYNLGKEHGKILTELGFNLDFSPIVEIRNNVWPGRAFKGNEKEISEKISNYIKGLHYYNVSSTAKHYPGGNLIKNPHLIKYKINATCSELNMFDVAIKNNVDFIMIGHPVIYGELDSNKKQATISPEIIQPLRKKFDGIIITDAVTMLGLRISYLFNFKKVYPDLILAGNDIILDTHKNSGYNSLLKRRNELKRAVIRGEIPVKRIDESVKRILEKKGYEVVG